MVLPLVLAISFLAINITLFASTFYQVLILSDLEADHINMFEAAPLINRWIVPDFALQGVLTLVFLITGHWLMSVVSIPITVYHAMLYAKRKHLIDVTEIFRVLGTEKKYRLVKLGLLSILLILVVFRLFMSPGHVTVYNSKLGELDIRSSFLEF